MRGTKSLILLLLVAIIISINTTRIGMSNPELLLYVDPPLSSVPPTETFDIYVTAGTDVEPVVDLFLAEFTLSWDPPLLYTDVDSINLGDVAPFLDFVYIKEVNNDEGWLKVTMGRPIGVKDGMTGTVQIAKITFLVEAEGSCALHLSETRLKDVSGTDLVHVTEDGRFANAQFIYSSDDTGAEKSIFPPGETIYVTGVFPLGLVTVDTYVVNNTEWSDGQAIGDYIYKTSVSFPGGVLPVTPLVQVGLYDIVVDYDQNGVYDAATDAVDDSTWTPGVMPDVHDIAITSVVPNATQVYIRPLDMPVVSINVTVLNEGAYSESFDVAAYYGNATYEKEIGRRLITDLQPGNSETKTFLWLPDIPGTYTIFAKNATAIPGEVDTADNRFDDGEVTVIQPVHDIAVTNVTASPTTVSPGEFVTINVTVENQGDFNETFSVTPKYELPPPALPTSAAPSQTVTDLEPDSSETLSFSWNTTNMNPGVYAIKGFASIVENETEVYDNQFKMTGKVTILGHDIAVTKVTASPTTVTPGEPVTIDVTVKNKGTATETLDVTAYYNTNIIGTQTLTDLAPVSSETLSFTWNTTGVAEGEYTIKAVAETVYGETSTDDNTREYALPVSLGPHDIAITDVTPSPTEVMVGETISINVTVVNEGIFIETFNVTVRYGENLVGTKTDVSLGVGATTTLNFTWDTAEVDPSDYRIIAEAIVDVDNDPDDNTKHYDFVTVQKNPVAAFTYSPTEPVVGEAVTFDASASVPNGGTIVSYTWDFDDGNITTVAEPTITHVYASSGNFNVTLSIEDSNGLTATATESITVKEAPATLGILLYVAAGIVIVAIATTLIYVLRGRKPKPT